MQKHTVGKLQTLHIIMKKILLISVAALAASAVSSLADPYSQNIVGYYAKPLAGSSAFSPINAPFLAGTNSVEALLPVIKKGDCVSLWNGGSFTTLTYVGPNFDGQGHAWADSQGNGQNSPAVWPNQAFLYQNNGAPVTNIFAGSVPLAATTTIPGHHTYTLLVSAIPIVGALDNTNLSLPLQAGDKVFILIGDRYHAFTYQGANFDGLGHAFADEAGQAQPSPVIQIGQAFFYQNNQDAAEIWNQSVKIK
jgi:hypothetical protein